MQAIRTSALEEKADACHQLVILVQAISSILPPDALKAVLQLAEPLLKVRSATLRDRRAHV